VALADELRDDVLERFLRYVQIDTQSAYGSGTYPSTTQQLNLQHLLLTELNELGVDAELTEHGYVFATLPGEPNTPTVGLLAHVDVSPDAPAAGVKPRVHENYDGESELVPGLAPANSPLLAERKGHDIVTSDGTTLLGADDKAGVAEIMAAVAYLKRHPEIPHANTRIAFTVDEEIGHGTDHFDLERFGADFAYTLDGSVVGEVEAETWSALELKVTFRGVPVHPGYAKDILVNPVKLAARFVASFPSDYAPEATEGRHGFLHPLSIAGNAEGVTVVCYVRDFDWDGLLAGEALLRRLAEEAIAGEPRASVEYERWEQYRNMKEKLDERPEVIEAALEATRRVGLEPKVTSIRGGTDGSRLTEMGLPTPNLFAGGNEFHSVREWVSVQDLALSAATAVELLKLLAEPQWQTA
jgi:tripeptide aminopeptidase